MSRTPTTPGAAQAAGVDYLLRKFRGLDMDKVAPDAPIRPPSADARLWDASITVAAYNARAEVRATADYVCGGGEDDAEIIAALTLGASLTSARVMLSEGNFIMPTQTRAVTLPIAANVGLYGLGSGITLISYYDSSDFDLQITYEANSGFGRFSIVELACGA